MTKPMPKSPTQPRGETASRKLPWSTRAVILLAFAIQLGSVGDRLTAPAFRPVDSLTLCDGRLLALWLDEAPADCPVAIAAVLWGSPVEVGEALPGIGGLRPVHAGLDQVGGAILPIPPPAAC